MKYVKFAESDVDVSIIGFGCWQMGRRMWSGVRDEDSIAAVRAALDCGVTLFDTANIYGFGHSEEILAKALGGDKDRVFIATKGGLRWDDQGRISHDNSADHLLEACAASLKRLGRDCVDLYQVHWPSPEQPLDEVMNGLNAIRKRGMARFAGVSNFFKDDLERLRSVGPLHSLQPQFNILKRKVQQNSTLEYCRKHSLTVLVYGPLCEGILTGRVAMETRFGRRDNRHGHDEYVPPERRAANLKIVDELRIIAENRGVSTAQVAINWTLRQPGVSVALCGSRTPDHIQDSARAAEWELNEAELNRIEEVVASHRPDIFNS